MKSSGIALIIAIIIAISAVTIFFFTPFMTISYNDSENPLLMIYNMDSNRTHSIQLSITNISGADVFKGTYVLNSGDSIIPDIYAPQIHKDYYFRITVDGEITSETLLNISPTRMVVIEIKSPYNNEDILFSIIDVTPSGHYRYFWGQL